MIKIDKKDPARAVAIALILLAFTACATAPSAIDDQEAGRSRIRVFTLICLLSFCQHELEVADASAGSTNLLDEDEQDADLEATVPVSALGQEIPEIPGITSVEVIEEFIE
mgnify:CR=1 FL=1